MNQSLLPLLDDLALEARYLYIIGSRRRLETGCMALIILVT